MVNYIDHFINDEDLRFPVSNFFVLVSRFEFALKCVQHSENKTYWRINRNGICTPQWGSFSSNVNSNLEEIDNEELQEARAYYHENPPKMETASQVFSDDAPDMSSIMQVYRVRCNLFHGGKYVLPEHDHDLNRYRLLIKYGTIILEEAIAVDEDVNSYFWKK